MTFRKSMIVISVVALAVTLRALNWSALGLETPATAMPAVKDLAAEETEFADHVRPLFNEFCLRCHNPDNMKSGVRLDHLAAVPDDKQLFLLKDIQKQIADGAMPPPEESQPTTDQRKVLTDWIEGAITAARSRNTQRNGSVRRLTVAQYRNTLKDLLGLEVNLTDVLPPDSLSKDGFVNNGQTLQLSPLQVESYFDIAEKALDLSIVEENTTPVIQDFRMEFGTGINPNPCPDRLILGADNALLNNPDFVVTELQPVKPFEYQPFTMRTHYDFIEGYVGNDTIRAWKKFDSIYHSVFACVRGTPGYPKGLAHQVVSNGLLLRPAIPSPEIFGQSNTYGPMANFKISQRELPEDGNFRVTVKARRYNDGLLLDAGAQVQNAAESVSVARADLSDPKPATVRLNEGGVYQVDIYCAPGASQNNLSLTLGDRAFTGQLFEQKPSSLLPDDANNVGLPTAFLLVRLTAGDLNLMARYGDNSRLRRIVMTKVPDYGDLGRRFSSFERRSPTLGVYLGLRRDCGSTLSRVDVPYHVEPSDLQDYVFKGAIKNFPNPDVEKDNVNYLAGIREIGVRSEYTDGRDMPRLLIRSVEFEGPYYGT